jgi:Spy/CpxP family protein refolding chaperone
MERTKLLTLASIGLLLLNLLTIGFLVLKPGQAVRPGHPPGPPGAEGPIAVIIERLQLDATQQAQYQQLVREHQHQARVLHEQSAQLFRDYYGLLESNHPDSAQATTLSQQIATNQQNMAQLNFTHFSQIKALCRPDQLANFNRLVSDLAKLFGQQPRPPRFDGDGPPEGPPGNLPPRP